MRKLFLFLLALTCIHLFAQKKLNAPANTDLDSTFFSKTKYRLVGPFRGGRSGAVTGDYKNKNTFYFGATGGGVWKTTDGGSNWTNISVAASAQWPLLPVTKILSTSGKAKTRCAEMSVRV